jgi:hypothetical protein
MRLRIGTAWESIADKRGRLEIYPEWRDFWIGMYVNEDAIYICPIPMVVFRFSRGRKEMSGWRM